MANKVQVIFEVDKDAQGRTTLKQIESGVTRLGRSAKQAGSDLDAFTNFFKGAFLVEFFRRGASEAFSFAQAAVKAFNDARAASLGLESVAKFRGIDAEAAKNTVENLDLVKSGLLSVGEASKAMQAILKRTSDLETATKLLQAFADNAAFGKQAGLSFGEAVVSQAEGYKQLNNQLLDNGGLTTNASVLIEQYGFKLEDLDNKTKKVAATQAFNNAILSDSAPNTGNAAKLTKEFAGEQAKLEAQERKLLETLGELITKNPELGNAFRSVGVTLEFLTTQLKDSDSSLSKFVASSVEKFSLLIDIAAKLARGIALVGEISDKIAPVGALTGSVLGPSKDEAQQQAEIKKRFDALRKGYLEEQQKLKTALAKNPIIDGEALAIGQKTTDEITKANDAYFKKLEEANKKFAQSIAEVGKATDDLQAKLSINPVAVAFEAAEKSRQAFIEKLHDVPKEFKDAFTQASKEVQALDLFRGVLGQAGDLAGLRAKLAELDAGGDPGKLAEVRRQQIQEEIDAAKKFLAIAQNPAQRQLALERLITATNNVNDLTPDQREIRRNALQQQITVQEQLFTENFKRLEQQIGAQKENTTALRAVGNTLSEVDRSLGNFAKQPITIQIENDTTADVDLGQSFINGTANQ